MIRHTIAFAAVAALFAAFTATQASADDYWDYLEDRREACEEYREDLREAREDYYDELDDHYRRGRVYRHRPYYYGAYRHGWRPTYRYGYRPGVWIRY